MSAKWWSMPGPSSYVDDIFQELREGKCIIAALPDHVPEGLQTALRRQVYEDAIWAWHTLHADDYEDSDPIELLFALFAPNSQPGIARTAASLAQQESFGCRLIRLDGLTRMTWEKWKRFIVEYSECIRNVPLVKRTLFLVVLTGETALYVPEQQVCLACHPWSNRVTFLDLQIYSALLVQEWRASELEKAVSASVLASLAEWDPEVAIRIGEAGPVGLTDPLPILAQMSKDRRWRGENIKSPAWHTGMVNSVDGVEKIHSAALAARADSAAIARRVWRGQVGVLLPFVDERRVDLIGALRGSLVLPFPTRFRNESITDPYDLEIGHIHHQLDRMIQASQDVHALVDCLYHIRTELSHLRPVDHRRLKQYELTKWSEILGSIQTRPGVA